MGSCNSCTCSHPHKLLLLSLLGTHQTALSIRKPLPMRWDFLTLSLYLTIFSSSSNSSPGSSAIRRTTQVNCMQRNITPMRPCSSSHLPTFTKNSTSPEKRPSLEILELIIVRRTFLFFLFFFFFFFFPSNLILIATIAAYLPRRGNVVNNTIMEEQEGEEQEEGGDSGYYFGTVPQGVSSPYFSQEEPLSPPVHPNPLSSQSTISPLTISSRQAFYLRTMSQGPKTTETDGTLVCFPFSPLLGK